MIPPTAGYDQREKKSNGAGHQRSLKKPEKLAMIERTIAKGFRMGRSARER